MKKSLIFIAGVLLVLLFLESTNAQVIFEDDFEYNWTPPGGRSNELYPCTKDIGGSCATSVSGTYPISAYPVGQRTNSNSWNGWSFPGGGYDVRINNTIGRNGGGAIQIKYPQGTGLTSEPRLIKYLGYPGYNDIYIRWFFKFEDTGPEKWVWGDGTWPSFRFMKLGRFYQGVNLDSLRPWQGHPNDYLVHPSSYPGFIIPDWVNANWGTSSMREVLPFFIPSSENNQHQGVSSYSLWYHYYRWNTPILNLDAAISPNDASTPYVIGPIYEPSEGGTPGEMKYAQNYHSLEMHFKLRELAESGSHIQATYLSDWSFKVSGDYTNLFIPGTLIKAENTGQWNGWNKPVLHEVGSSTYSSSQDETTVNLVIQPTFEGPHLTSSITTVVKMIETSPGIVEIWIDGVTAGNHQTDFSKTTNSNTLANNNLDGGFTYLIISDNIWMDRPHPVTMYIDDVVISTNPIGHNYTIGGSCIPTRHPADLDCDDLIDITELMIYINQWKNNEVGVTISTLFEALVIWKTG